MLSILGNESIFVRSTAGRTAEEWAANRRNELREELAILDQKMQDVDHLMLNFRTRNMLFSAGEISFIADDPFDRMRLASIWLGLCRERDVLIPARAAVLEELASLPR